VEVVEGGARPMRRIVALAGMLASLALVTLAVGPAAQAAAKEQVIFSGEADGTAGEVGFWVWCAVDEAGNYDDCRGAIQFDVLHLTKHMDGEVSEIGEDVYQMDVSSSDGSIACTLTNEPPINHGPTNTVDISCSSPSSTAQSTDAVVVSTGG
jgi:hypothetical protein